jgi:serine/threonine protein kinase
MMWGIDVVPLTIILIYAVLALNVVILLGMRIRKRSRPRSEQGKTQLRLSRGDDTYTINRRYQLRVPPHKKGGMATIWLAVDLKTGRECIIKTPRRGTRIDNVYLDKLMLEAGFLKKLKHDGIVKYLTDFYYEGEFHLVIEYLHGETLLAASHRVPFTEPQVIAWGGQLLDTLSYLHAASIVHRDINPKNIMLCSDGSVKLIDFGTAKNLNNGDEDKTSRDPFTQITNKGFDIPELFIGGDIDQRCDLCGLAQTCIYLLTLKQPNEICLDLFKANWPRSYSEAAAVADYLISRGISKRLARCLAQCILFSPDNRFADARAFKAALSSADGYPLKAVKVVVKK